jgi:predicted dehydrogenase
MLQTLVVGLGRAGSRLHLPVLSQARTQGISRHLFADRPFIAFDPRGSQDELPGTVRANSLTQAAALVDPNRTVVHLCTPPTARVELLEQLARLGFRKVLIEKPLAVDEWGLVEIARIRRRWQLDVVVMAQWLVSALTRRIQDILRSGELGVLRSLFVAQRKPRFTRSLTGDGHPTAFDVEMPHSIGVALALAGDASLSDASWLDMTFGDVVIPRMGGAWLCLHHKRGARTEIVSDLMSPVRERRITLTLEGGTLTGHYPISDADDTAQLSIRTGGHETHAVFRDDALTAFMLRTYEHFASPARSGDLALNIEVIRLLGEAKRMCVRRERQWAAEPLPVRRERVGTHAR